MYDTKPYFYGTGRRKSSVARVRILPGTGAITINGRDIDDYFGLETLKLIVRQPLEATETLGKFDLIVKRWRRRRVGSGRRHPPRPVPRPAAGQRRIPSHPQGGGLPHPRPPHEGKKEVRPQGSPPCAPVLQEITCAGTARIRPWHTEGFHHLCFLRERGAKQHPFLFFPVRRRVLTPHFPPICPFPNFFGISGRINLQIPLALSVFSTPKEGTMW